MLLSTKRIVLRKAHFANYYPNLPMQRLQKLNAVLGRPRNLSCEFEKEKAKINQFRAYRFILQYGKFGIFRNCAGGDKKERHKIFIYKKYLELLNDGQPVNTYKM